MKSALVGIYRLSLILLLALSLQEASAGVKSIEQVFPRCGQQGTVVEVEIWGVSLDEPKEIIFYQPGIRAFDFQVKEDPPKRRNLAHGGYWDQAVTCKFEIAPDCPPGQYAFRLLTKTELSHLATFHVSPFPTVDESEAVKDTIETAEAVEPNLTINGVLGHHMADCFRVPVKAGERLSVELESVRVADFHYGASSYDLEVRILDLSGKVLASNDDNSLRIQDPVLSWIPETDGEVIVMARRSVDQITQTRYVLHIGNHPRPLVAFPPGGKAGSEQTIRFIGDASGEIETKVAVPKVAGFFDYSGEAPTTMRLRSSSFANTLESDSDDPKAVTEVPELPGALNGIIDRYDDVDRYRISVEKDVPLRLRVFAASVGSPIDPVLRILDTEGEVVMESDDASLPERDIFGTSYRSKSGRPDLLDPSVMWTPEADGDYLVEISDQSAAGGPDGVYRIEIESPGPVVQTVLKSFSFDWVENTRDTGLALPQGGRLVANITLPEGQWKKFEAPFDLVAHGLPEGVTMTGPRIDPATVGRDRRGDDLWPVLFTATPDAKIEGAVITLEARPVDSEVTVETRCQENVPFLNHSGGDSLHFAMVDRYVMGVTEPSPFSIEIEAPNAVLVRGGEIAIPVTLTRHGDFDGPVEFQARFADLGIDPQAPTTIPPGETEAVLRLTATSRAPLGKRPIAVSARSLVDEIPRSAGVGDRRNCSSIIELTVAEPYLELTAEPGSVRRGETTEYRWKVTQKTPFDGTARIQMLGLPKGVSLVGELPEIDSSASEVVFQVKATDEALLGQATGLECEIVLTSGGQEITQRSGSGILRIDPVAVETAANN